MTVNYISPRIHGINYFLQKKSKKISTYYEIQINTATVPLFKGEIIFTLLVESFQTCFFRI